jgi:hypothetical protein
MKREDWLRVFDERHELLEAIGAKSVNRAKVKLDNERKEFLNTKTQLLAVVDALEVDNWRNAVVRAKSLLDKIEQNRMPKWLLTISPAWIDKIRPSDYKRMHRNCQEQFLVLLSELETRAEDDLDFDIDRVLEEVKKFYLSNTPGKFIEEVALYLNQEYMDEETENTEEAEK